MKRIFHDSDTSLFDTLFQNLLDIEPETSAQVKTTPWSHYQSHRDFCTSEFNHMKFAPDVLTMFDSLDANIETYAQSANSTGKTHGAVCAATSFYKRFPGAKVFTLAAPPEDNLKLLFWGEMGKLIDQYPLLYASDKISLASMRIERNSYEFIDSVTIPATGTPEQRQARASGKHAPALLFIADEGDAIPPEIYRGIESCMTGSYVRLLILFNPRSKSGPVYNKQQMNSGKTVKLSALTHPNVVSGNDIIPGAVDRNTTVRRINIWSRELVPGEAHDHECFRVPDYLVGSTATSNTADEPNYPPLPAGYRKVHVSSLWDVVIGEYPTQAESQLISSAWIDAAVARWYAYVAQWGESPPAGIRPIIGQDVGEYGPDSSVCMLRYGGWIPYPTEWNGVDPLVTADKCYNTATETNAYLVNVDGTGIGSGVVPGIERQAKADRYPIQVNRVMFGSKPDPVAHQTNLGVFRNLRDLLSWSVREWLRKDTGAMLPPIKRLRTELLAPKYRVEKNELKVTEKPVLKEILNGVSPDYLDALMLTFYVEIKQKTSRLGQQDGVYSGDQKAAGNRLAQTKASRITVGKGTY